MDQTLPQLAVTAFVMLIVVINPVAVAPRGGRRRHTQHVRRRAPGKLLGSVRLIGALVLAGRSQTRTTAQSAEAGHPCNGLATK
jgi:hypothetical protein